MGSHVFSFFRVRDICVQAEAAQQRRTDCGRVGSKIKFHLPFRSGSVRFLPSRSFLACVLSGITVFHFARARAYSLTVQNDKVTPLDLLLEFLPLPIFAQMALHTNASINSYLESASLKAWREQQTRNWREVTLADMVQFHGLHVGMTAVKVPNWKLYWSTEDRIALPSFASTMNRLRYELIRSNLTLVDRLFSLQ